MNLQMASPNFPVTLHELSATSDFTTGSRNDRKVSDAVVHTEKLNHPGGSIGYRLERLDKILVYASDTEHVDGLDPLLLEFVRGADALIYDGMFTPDQYSGVTDDSRGNHGT